MKKTLWIVGLVFLSGCYTYQPMQMPQVTPELEVRATITAVEADRLAEVLGDDVRRIEGSVESITTGQGLLLRVPVVSSIQRGTAGSLNQLVEIPGASIVEIEVKELDRTRTGLVFGSVALAGAVLVLRELTAGQSDGPNPDPSPLPEDRVLRFWLPIRW